MRKVLGPGPKTFFLLKDVHEGGIKVYPGVYSHFLENIYSLCYINILKFEIAQFIA